MVDNKQLARHLEFELTEAMMLQHALMIACNTAMMSGHYIAYHRFKELEEQLRNIIPEDLRRIFHPSIFVELGVRIKAANVITVGIKRELSTWYKTGYIVITLDALSLRSEKNIYTTDSREFVALLEFLRMIAPIHATVSPTE